MSATTSPAAFLLSCSFLVRDRSVCVPLFPSYLPELFVLTVPECACPCIASTLPRTCTDDLLIRAYDITAHLTCMGSSLLIFQLPLEQLLQIVEVGFSATGLIEVLLAKSALRSWAAL